MARRFESLYRVKDGVTRLGEKFLNAVFSDIDLRLHDVEEAKADYVEAVNQITSKGLTRIDEVLLPAFEQIQQLAEFGFLVAQADPAAPITFVTGEQEVSIPSGPQRSLFSPTPFVVLTREDSPDDWAVAELQSYDKDTGLLAVDVLAVHGAAGPHTDVWVAASGGSEIAAREFLAQAKTARDDAASSASTASTAATAATAAQTQISAFNKQYLGAKAANPTVDNSGGALQIGAFYWNTSTNVLMVYGSGGWTPASSAVTGISNTQTWTATAGQTTFAVTGGYDPGRVLVFLNGVKQVNGTDVTVSSGTNLVFASALAAGDVVDLMAFGSFQLADVLTKVQNLADVPDKDAALANLGGTVTGRSLFKAASASAARSAIQAAFVDDLVALAGVVAGKADASAVATALAGKSNTGHTLVAAEITDFSSAVAAVAVGKMEVVQDTTVNPASPVAYVEHTVDFSVYAYAVTIVRGISGTGASPTLLIYTRNASTNRDGVVSSATFGAATTQCAQVSWHRSGLFYSEPTQEFYTDVGRIRIAYSTGYIDAGRVTTFGIKY